MALSEVVPTRVSESERELLKIMATERGLTESALVRLLILSEIRKKLRDDFSLTSVVCPQCSGDLHVADFADDVLVCPACGPVVDLGANGEEA